jgi:hypothetical protein
MLEELGVDCTQVRNLTRVAAYLGGNADLLGLPLRTGKSTDVSTSRVDQDGRLFTADDLARVASQVTKTVVEQLLGRDQGASKPEQRSVFRK